MLWEKQYVVQIIKHALENMRYCYLCFPHLTGKTFAVLEDLDRIRLCCFNSSLYIKAIFLWPNFPPLSTFVLEETARTHFEGMLCSRLCTRIFAHIASELQPCPQLYTSKETIFSTVLFPGKEKPQHKSNS